MYNRSITILYYILQHYILIIIVMIMIVMMIMIITRYNLGTIYINVYNTSIVLRHSTTRSMSSTSLRIVGTWFRTPGFAAGFGADFKEVLL